MIFMVRVRTHVHARFHIPGESLFLCGNGQALSFYAPDLQEFVLNSFIREALPYALPFYGVYR